MQHRDTDLLHPSVVQWFLLLTMPHVFLWNWLVFLFFLFPLSEPIRSYLYTNTVLRNPIPIIVSTYWRAQVCVCVSVCLCVCLHMRYLLRAGECLPTCLPLVSECLPKECTMSDLSLTLIVQLIQLVPWGRVALCPGKWEVCAFHPPFPLLLSVFAHVHFLNVCRGGKVFRMVDAFGVKMRGVRSCVEKSRKWIIKLIKLNVTDFREFYKSRNAWALLLLNAVTDKSPCLFCTWATWKEINSPVVFKYALRKLKWEKKINSMTWVIRVNQ